MRYEQWTLPRPPSRQALRRMEQAGLPPLCAAVLCARGVVTPDKAAAFLTQSSVLLRDPFLLGGMDRAAARIRRALELGEGIAVYGALTWAASPSPAFPWGFCLGLDGRGACRVHGGGFAGTIQAFVPLDLLERFRSEMDRVLGTGACHVLSIRPVGGVRLA